jgi:hypothetical protein
MGGSRGIDVRLAKLEALFARGATDGERAAAGAAIDRLQARREDGGGAGGSSDRASSRASAHGPGRGPATEPEVELQYTLPDLWSVRLFIALCRKADVQPYRYPRQRRTTVMVRVRPSVFEHGVLAEFSALHGALTEAFGDIVAHLIADVMRGDGDDTALEQPRIAAPR